MLHEIYSHEEEITCPHCRYSFENSCDYRETGSIECIKCDEPFYVELEFEVSYSSYITHEQWKKKKDSKQ